MLFDRALQGSLPDQDLRIVKGTIPGATQIVERSTLLVFKQRRVLPDMKEELGHILQIGSIAVRVAAFRT